MASKTRYIFVDHENVQPDRLPISNTEKVFVFVGDSQKSIKKELVIPMQKLGPRAEYIEITGSGKNALDFHIAFYMGKIAAKDPNCEFCIISNDQGYDPLIAHLKEECKIKAERMPGKAKTTKKKKAPNNTTKKEKAPNGNKKATTGIATDIIEKVIYNLDKIKAKRPKTSETLTHHIQAQTKLSDQQVEQIIKELKNKKHLKVSANGKVEYNN